MIAIASLLLAWLLIATLARSYDAALERHLEAVDRNGRVRALAEVRAPNPAVGTPPVGAPDLALIVAESAAQAGLALASNSAAGADTVNVTITQARPTAAVQWLRDFELRGIRAEDLRMVPGADGSVSVNARLVRNRR